jgi:hypothetical protein
VGDELAGEKSERGDVIGGMGEDRQVAVEIIDLAIALLEREFAGDRGATGREHGKELAIRRTKIRESMEPIPHTSNQRHYLRNSQWLDLLPARMQEMCIRLPHFYHPPQLKSAIHRHESLRISDDVLSNPCMRWRGVHHERFSKSIKHQSRMARLGKQTMSRTASTLIDSWREAPSFPFTIVESAHHRLRRRLGSPLA